MWAGDVRPELEAFARALAPKLAQGISEMKDLDGDSREAAIRLGFYKEGWRRHAAELPKEADRLTDLWAQVQGCDGLRRSGSRILCASGPGGQDLGSLMLEVPVQLHPSELIVAGS